MDDRQEYRKELAQYVGGLVVAVILTAIPFALVGAHALTRHSALIVIAVLGLLQVIAHFRLFLDINLSKSKRDDLQLILFSTLIVVLMVSGTVWIFYNQHARMM